MKKIIITILVITSLFFSVSGVLAQGTGPGLESMQTDLGDFGRTSYGEETPTPLPQTIGQIIGVVLGFLGVILVVLIMYGGFLYMTSGGDETKTKKGKGYIINSVIGLVICLTAWAISSFVVSRLVEAVIE